MFTQIRCIIITPRRTHRTHRTQRTYNIQWTWPMMDELVDIRRDRNRAYYNQHGRRFIAKTFDRNHDIVLHSY